jgi:tetratricopeptide (TPR) repeat protein
MGEIYVCPEIDICWTFINTGDYKKAIEVGQLAVKKYPENSEAYLCLGIAYYNVGELNLALETLTKAESLTSNKEHLMDIYNIIGNALYEVGHLKDALLYYIKSLNLAEDLGNTDMQAIILNNIAGIYKDEGALDKALSYYQESLRLKKDEKTKAPTYNNIAMIYFQKGDYQKAVECFQKALEINEKYENSHKASIVKLNLGNLYREMKNYENAEKYLLEGLKGVKKAEDKFFEAIGYKYLGWLYEDKGDKKTAKEYLTRAYNLFKSIGAEKYAQSILEDIKRIG